MKLYKITYSAGTKFVGSLQDGIAYRKELREKHGYARSTIKQEEVNVPTDKPGLLGFLNKVPA